MHAGHGDTMAERMAALGVLMTAPGEDADERPEVSDRVSAGQPNRRRSEGTYRDSAVTVRVRDS
jgi:hypothetical protein